jgi:hypothetical protein
MLRLFERFNSDVIKNPGRNDAQEASAEKQNNFIHIFIRLPPECIGEEERDNIYWKRTLITDEEYSATDIIFH